MLNEWKKNYFQPVCMCVALTTIHRAKQKHLHSSLLSASNPAK